MNFYKTAEVVRIGGVIGLSDKQARLRAGRITPEENRKGVYTMKEPLDFKAGELIGLEEVPKGLIRKLVGGDSGGDPTVFDADGKEVAPTEKPAKAGKSAEHSDAKPPTGGKSAKAGRSA